MDVTSERLTATPDVSVIVPVHNTMPYLVECLDSLLAQTILQERGPGSAEVVVVDDGSTDGSPELLTRYAAEHPELFRLTLQGSSGGPATPRNRGLDVARGRYVYFLDADDYLAPYALERLVANADEWGSDVAFGRMVGVNGRWVDQRIFAGTLPEVDLTHPLLPFALSITKLFRRTLVEQQRLRFDPSLRIGSDQPFTIDAMLAARRISVLADDVYYYAVRRDDASNITYASGWATRLRDTTRLVHHVTARVPAGELRDNILHRHFAWELDKLLQRTWDELDDAGRSRLAAGVGALAAEHLTEAIAVRLPVATRLRLRLAEGGDVAGLERLAAFEAAGDRPGLLLGPEHASLMFPGHGELPDAWFQLTSGPLPLADAVRLTRLVWDGPVLQVEGAARLHPESTGRVRLALVPVPEGRPVPDVTEQARGTEAGERSWPLTLVASDEAGCSRFTARLDLSHLLRLPEVAGDRWALRVRLDVGDRTHDLPATGARGSQVQVRDRGRFYVLAVRRDKQGRTVVRRRRVPLGQLLRKGARRLLPRRAA